MQLMDVVTRGNEEFLAANATAMKYGGGGIQNLSIYPHDSA